MKKTLYLMTFIFLILLSSCGKQEIAKNEKGEIKMQSGIYHDKNWDDSVGSYERDVIPNEKTAVEIAKSIFDGMEKSKESQKFMPQSVFFDEQDEVWIVSFWEVSKNTKTATVGGDCSIAMQKKDGKVLRIWFGE